MLVESLELGCGPTMEAVWRGTPADCPLSECCYGMRSVTLEFHSTEALGYNVPFCTFFGSK